MVRFGPGRTAKLMSRVRLEKTRDCRYELRASAARPQHSIANADSATAQPSPRMKRRKRRLCGRGSDRPRHLGRSKRSKTASTMVSKRRNRPERSFQRSIALGVQNVLRLRRAARCYPLLWWIIAGNRGGDIGWRAFARRRHERHLADATSSAQFPDFLSVQ